MAKRGRAGLLPRLTGLSGSAQMQIEERSILDKVMYSLRINEKWWPSACSVSKIVDHDWDRVGRKPGLYVPDS